MARPVSRDQPALALAPHLSSPFLSHLCALLLDQAPHEFVGALRIALADVPPSDHSQARTLLQEYFAIYASGVVHTNPSLISARAQETAIQTAASTSVCLRSASCCCHDCVAQAQMLIGEYKESLEPATSTLNHSAHHRGAAEFVKKTKQQQLDLLKTAYSREEKVDFLVILSEPAMTFEDTRLQDQLFDALLRLVRDPTGVPSDHLSQATVLLMGIKGAACFPRLFELCMGVSDSSRWRALQLLLEAARPKIRQMASTTAPDTFFQDVRFPTQGAMCRQLSDKVYTQAYDMDKWIKDLLHCTPRTLVVSLSKVELEALLQNNKRTGTAIHDWLRQAEHSVRKRSLLLEAAARRWASEPSHASPALTTLMQRLDHAVATFLDSSSSGQSSGFFLKLSTRSPKDSTLLPCRELSMAATVHGDKLLICPDETAAEAAERHSMHVFSVAEALDLLSSSSRVRIDLEDMLNLSHLMTTVESLRAAPLSLVAREWVDIPHWSELRGFVCGGKLNAISQYFADSHSAPLWRWREQIQQLVCTFFETSLSPSLKRLGLEHAVVDFGLVPPRSQLAVPSGPRVHADSAAANKKVADSSEKKAGRGPASSLHGWRVVVLELNSFGFRSGACLFSWDDEQDYRTLLHGPFQMRCIPPPT